MPAKSKILWVVGYDDVDVFRDLALRAEVTGVAIRTSNDVATAIPKFHSDGIKVYGWRWPSASQDPALLQARRAAALIKDHGMDGYFVDPEGEPGAHYDWNKPGLGDLAKEFCATVKAASSTARFGVTSHYKAKLVFPELPWKEFFAAADVLLPQAYWRVAGGNVYKGDPAQNYRLSLKHWENSGGDANLIVPMAGEIALTNAAKVTAYADEATAQGRDELHFYTSTPSVSTAVWKAIAAA